MLQGNILIIDVKKMIRKSVTAFLEKQNYARFSASNGAEGLLLFEKEQINCVILDLILPDRGGEEICQIIRKQSDVPVIMLTAKRSGKRPTAALFRRFRRAVGKYPKRRSVMWRARSPIPRTSSTGRMIPAIRGCAFPNGSISPSSKSINIWRTPSRPHAGCRGTL